jgi:hypothetical protein
MLTEILTVTGDNNLIVLGLRRWFGVVDSSCWFVDVHCKWYCAWSTTYLTIESLTVLQDNLTMTVG